MPKVALVIHTIFLTGIDVVRTVVDIAGKHHRRPRPNSR